MEPSAQDLDRKIKHIQRLLNTMMVWSARDPWRHYFPLLVAYKARREALVGRARVVAKAS